MSVEKVNKYKEDKKNRKQILEKEKRKKKLYRIGGWTLGAVIVIALVAMLGLTARNAYNDYLASQPDYERSYLVISDMVGILDELDSETEEADSEEETAEDTATEEETAEDTGTEEETAEE